MRVVMISTDAQVLQIGSPVYMRMREYADLVDELHIIVLCGKKSGVEIHDDTMHLYPTNSNKKILRLKDAYNVASRVIQERRMTGEDSLITVQDPFELGIIGVQLKKKFNLKLQIQIHTDFTNKNFIEESLKNKTRNFIAFHTLKYANHIRVVGDHIKHALTQRGCKQEIISVLPIFVDIAEIQRAEAIDLSKKYPGFGYFIVMISRLTHEKQVVWAAECIARVREKHPEACLVIVGEGPDRTKLEAFDFVRVAGWIKDPIGHLKGADLFLNTSLYEGYGRSLVEAVSAEVPVITSNVGVAQEIVGKAGIVISEHEMDEFVARICDVIEGRVSFEFKKMEAVSKTAYLQAYLETWEQCFE